MQSKPSQLARLLRLNAEGVNAFTNKDVPGFEVYRAVVDAYEKSCADYAGATWAENVEAERLKYEGSLFEFFKRAWQEFDPSPLKVGAHHWLICKHLEAISHGDFTANGYRKFLCNVPPRCTKSNLVNVCWLAWMWAQRDIGPLSGPQVRFLAISYGDRLSKDIARTSRRLILSEWYQGLWGHQVKILDDQSGIDNYGNTAGGSRIATSMSGATLGRGGDIRCFPGDEIIWTEHGPKRIDDVVRDRAPIRVWSADTETGRVGLRHLTAWFQNPGREIVELRLELGQTLRCTPDHRLWTERGWLRADAIHAGDRVAQMGPAEAVPDIEDGLPVDAKAFGQFPGAVRASEGLPGLLLSQPSQRTGGPSPTPIRLFDVAQVTPSCAGPQRHNSSTLNAVTGSQDTGGLYTRQNLDGLDFCQFGTVPFFTKGEGAVAASIFNVVEPSSVAQITQSGIASFAVKVTNFLIRRRRPDECERDDLMNPSRPSFLRGRQVHSGVTISSIWLTAQHLSAKLHVLAGFLKSGPIDTAHPTEGAGLVGSFPPGHIPPYLRFAAVEQIKLLGHAPLTYCVEVEQTHSMFMGEARILSSNCLDDPHKIEEAESEDERQRIVRTYDEALSTRDTDPSTSVEVCIMQRIHEQDISGHILSTSTDDLVHLCLPMRYDPERHCQTPFGEDWRTEDGQLLWPEQFPRDIVDQRERRMGPYAFAGQYMQIPSPRGGGIIEKEWWQVWPEVPPPLGQPVQLPDVSFVLVSLDTAISEEEQASYNACTVWGIWHRAPNAPRTQRVTDSGADMRGVFADRAGMVERAFLIPEWVGRLPQSEQEEWLKQRREKTLRYTPTNYAHDLRDEEQPRIILMEAWRRRCRLHDPTLGPDGQPKGLVERVLDTARRRHANALVIENKTRGKDVQQELQRMMRAAEFGVHLFEPRKHGDKVSRLLSVQPLFTGGLVYAPVAYDPVTGEQQEFRWCQSVISEIAQVPKGQFNDLADSSSQGLIWLREAGLILLTEEHIQEQLESRAFRPKRESVAQHYGV